MVKPIGKFCLKSVLRVTVNYQKQLQKLTWNFEDFVNPGSIIGVDLRAIQLSA